MFLHDWFLNKTWDILSIILSYKKSLELPIIDCDFWLYQVAELQLLLNNSMDSIWYQTWRLWRDVTSHRTRLSCISGVCTAVCGFDLHQVRYPGFCQHTIIGGDVWPDFEGIIIKDVCITKGKQIGVLVGAFEFGRI